MTVGPCGCNHLASQHDGACRECNCPKWHADHEIVDVMINGRWPLRLPDYRACRKSWPWHEAARLSAMHYFLDAGDLIIDVGAEEGDFGALFSTWGCRVVLVEPNPKAWPSIKASFEANDAKPEACVVGLMSDRTWGDVMVTKNGWPAEADDELIAEHGFFHLAEHDEVAPGATIDSLVSTLDEPPTAITIDVEGGELFVLRGATETLRRHRPKVWVSIHPEFMRDLYDQDASEVHRLMIAAGYEATFLATDHEHHWQYLPL